jgi:hypothetical protein
MAPPREGVPWLYVLIGGNPILIGQNAGASLVVLDGTTPSQPRLVARLPLPYATDMAVSADGKLALVHTETWVEGRQRPQAVVGLDLADPRAPSVRWRYTADAERLVLSPDARRFALIGRTGVTGVEIYDADLTGSSLRMLIPQSSAPQLRFSPNGQLLVVSGHDMRAFKLDGPNPTEPVTTKYAPGIRGLNNLWLIGVSNSGRVFMRRYHELWIYAAEGVFPRIGRLSRGSTGYPCGWQGEELCMTVGATEVVSMDLRIPAAPGPVHRWQTEASWRPLAMGRNGLLYVAAGDTLGVVEAVGSEDLARGIVDPGVLRQAHTDALANFAGKRGVSGRGPARNAVRRLEEGGVQLAITVPSPGMQRKELARILHDYGRWLTMAEREEDAAIAALERAIQLDPTPPVFHLDLAVALRKHLAWTATFDEKIALSQEIMAQYRRYLALGGKRQAGLENFLRHNLVVRPPADVCEAVREYTKAGRLEELFGSGDGVQTKEGQTLRLEVNMQGTAHYPTLDAYDAETDEGVEFPLPDHWGDGGDEFAVIPFRDGHYVLWYRNEHLPPRYRDEYHPKELIPAGPTDGPSCRF